VGGRERGGEKERGREEREIGAREREIYIHTCTYIHA
jgi:hypothetical protein